MKNYDNTIMRFMERIRNLLRNEKIEPRVYQYWILNAILKAKLEKKNVIVELDAGMGKRIITYLIARAFNKERILVVSPSRASIWDMALKFQELSGSDGWFGIIIGGQPKWLKKKVLREKRVILATPISLARLLEHCGETPNFDIIVINEVDKAVRRVLRRSHTVSDREEHGVSRFENLIGDSRGHIREGQGMLTYPWNMLKRLLPKDACWVGMSGTLRDEHYVIDYERKVIMQRELNTIASELFPEKELVIITMETLLERTDLGEYITRNLTVIQPVPVQDANIEIISNAISAEIEKVLDRIREYNNKLYPDEQTPFETKEKIMKTISILPDTNPLKIKFLRLALVRRFLFAGVPATYIRFLSKPMFRKLLREFKNVELEDVVPESSTKILQIVEITKSWLHRGKNVIILTSFVRTASEIARNLRESGVSRVLLLTGRVANKKRVIEEFKKSTSSVLILTPVAERDLDFPEANLVIVHDVISTVKSMYQRIKRARRSLVLILYYKNTYEEKKVKVLLARIARRYPWSIRIRSEK